MWESMLVENKSQWLLGAKLTQADAEAVKEMAGKKPNPKTHPNLFAWAAMTFKMSAAAQAKWPAGELPRPANAVGDQTSQIAALAAKVGKLDALSKESVVSDPIRKVQE